MGAWDGRPEGPGKWHWLAGRKGLRPAYWNGSAWRVADEIGRTMVRSADTVARRYGYWSPLLPTGLELTRNNVRVGDVVRLKPMRPSEPLDVTVVELDEESFDMEARGSPFTAGIIFEYRDPDDPRAEDGVVKGYAFLNRLELVRRAGEPA